jgi:enediyne biosynthesis protein E4
MKINYVLMVIIIILVFVWIYNKMKSETMTYYNMSFVDVVKFGINQVRGYLFPSKLKELHYMKLSTSYSRKYPYLKKPQRLRQNLPYAGSAAIDIHGNGKEYAFIGMASGQDDLLLKYDKLEKKLVNVIQGTDLSSQKVTYAAAAFDMSGNGKTDLIVARSSGLFIYVNEGLMKFKKYRITPPFTDSVPASIAIGDYNLNGKPDIYISRFTQSEKLLAFQYHNPKHYKKGILLENQGNMKFKDVTDKSHAGGKQNTFTSVFIDLGSGRPDIVMAHDNGPIEILENRKGKKFKSIDLHDTMDLPYGFWMGLAVGDFNNNGKWDFFFTNIGNTMSVPKSGGIRGNPKKGGAKPTDKVTNKHILIEHTGNHEFKDVSDIANVSDYGFAWGCVMEDINLDGYQDIIFAQNYIDFPKTLKGVVLMNQKNGTFKRVDALENPEFGHTPLFVDFEGEGFKDMIWVNMHGPIYGYKIDNKEGNNYISIRLPDSVKYLNATVKLHYKENGKDMIQMRQNIIGGIGFGSDQSHIMTFGLGKNNEVDKLTIETLYGNKQTINKPQINSIIKISDKVKKDKHVRFKE